MNAYRLNHFYNVAAAMNNYVAVSAYNYYNQNQYFHTIRDQGNYLVTYERPSVLNSGLSSLFAYGLSAIGMPASVVNFGYRFGYFIDSNA